MLCKSTKYLNMKSIFSSIFLVFFLLPSVSYSQIRISGTDGITMDAREQPAEFVRKEVVITKTTVEKGPNPIVITNKISNAKVYGTEQGITVDLDSQNKPKESNSNQIVIDLAEAKKEMDLANKFSASTLDNPNLIGFVFFDVNSSRLRTEYFQELSKLQEVLTNMPDMNIQIIGHADLKASENGNTQIASARTQSIFDYLTNSKHMDPNRFELSTAQENFFKIPGQAKINATDQSEKNRSVSFILVERKKQPSVVTEIKKTPVVEDVRSNEVASTTYKNIEEGEVVGFIFFDENSKKVKQEYYSELFKLNSVLENMPNTQIVLVGHGDVKASEKNNGLIGKERSESVFNFLTGIFKMDSKRFEVYHEGENNFKIPSGNTVNAANKTEMNRSVTIILKQN